MSYYQKYQKINNSRPSSQTHETSFGDQSSSDIKKNSESRQSYLKAFKKYYIEKLLDNKLGNSQIDSKTNNKENFCFHETHSEAHRISRETDKLQKIKMSVMTENHGRSRDEIRKEGKSEPRREVPMSRSKISHIVRNNDCELEQLLYDSISQMEREMQSFEDNDLVRENKQLKASITRLKLILKEKLEIALKKNKQEMTMMFDQYSNMIRKLLEDKEILTNQLESMRTKLQKEQHRVTMVEQEYENKIRIMEEENNQQVASTKQQIEQFLDMIVQYEEQSTQERQQLQKLRQKVVQLEMENDRLKCNSSSKYSSNQQDLELTNKEINQRYSQKIENLLDILERLQTENAELNHFLKTCKCSRIKTRHESTHSASEGDILNKYERKLMEMEKAAMKEEGLLMEALKKKDQCIDRLNLVIEELRKTRYASVDQMTEDMLARQVE